MCVPLPAQLFHLVLQHSRLLLHAYRTSCPSILQVIRHVSKRGSMGAVLCGDLNTKAGAAHCRTKYESWLTNRIFFLL